MGEGYTFDPSGTDTYAGQAEEVYQKQQGWNVFSSADEEKTAEYRQAQHRALSQAAETREAPPMPGTDYRAYEHERMKAMVEEDMSPGQINQAGEAWHNLGSKLRDIATTLRKSAADSEHDWQGRGGDAARNFAEGLSGWLDSSGQGAQLAGNRMHAQSEAASTAKHSMPEPVPFDLRQELAELKANPDPFTWSDRVAGFQDRYMEHVRAKEQAADVMHTYSNTLAESGQSMPAFAAPPALDGGGGSDGGADNGGGISGPAPHDFRGRGDAEGVRARYPGISEPVVPGGPPDTPDTGPGDRNHLGTGQGPGSGGWREPGTAGADPGSTSSAGYTAPGAGAVPVSGYPGGSGYSGGSGYPGGGGPGGHGAFGGMAPGAGPGSSGGTGSGAGGVGPRAPGSGAAAPGTGGRTGSGTPGGAGGRPMTTGASGTTAGGRTGMAGAPMGTGGRGGKDEDTEHERPSYLVEADPWGTFGTDELTAPPVIGEEPPRG